MSKFKKVILLVFSVILVCSFSSCTKPGTELADLMIMQGIGIDKNEGKYTVTVEILNNEQSGSPGGDSGSPQKTKVYSAEGETVSQALRKLTTKSGNLPLFAHNRVIIIGEEAAKDDLSDLLDFFERDYDSRPSQVLCVAKSTTAEKIIRAKLLDDSIKSEILENMLQESNNQSVVPLVRIIDAVNAFKDETASLCLPCITVQKNGENENYELWGCALFGRNNRFSNYLDLEKVSGLAFLDDKIEKGSITADIPNGRKTTFLINKGKTKCRILTENGKLVYNLHISVSCDLNEVQGDEYFNKPQGLLDTFKNAVSSEIVKKTHETFFALCGENGADAVRFGKRLRLKDVKAYNNLKMDWENVFPQIELRVTADVTIRRIGEETFHSRKK